MTFLSLALAGALAWLLSTVAAGGAATLLVPVVGLLLGAQFAAPVISVASLVANPSRVWLFRSGIQWPVVAVMLPGTLPGAMLGAWALSRVAPQKLQLCVGLFLIAYATIGAMARGADLLQLRRRIWLLPAAFIAAFISGLAGASGPINSPALLSHGLDRERLVGTKAVNTLGMQLTKLSSYLALGLLTRDVLVHGLALGIGAAAGIVLARRHLLRINARRFRWYVLGAMAAAGLLMVLRSIGVAGVPPG